MRNWKTTLIGVLGGLAMIVGQAAKARESGGPPITLGNLAPGIALAILGAVSKDHDVSGGDR